MRIDYKEITGEGRVLCFFNGWGMDSQVVDHIACDCDVVIVSDYRDLLEGDFSFLTRYDEVFVIAWSMGVWAAANILTTWNIIPAKSVALNGTEKPVDDEYGIPVKIYALTERGMNEKGRDKFLQRMGNTEDERIFLEEKKSKRTLEDVREELSEIWSQSKVFTHTLKWDRVFISNHDVVFTPTAQNRWWSGRVKNIVELEGGHFPFYGIKKWEQLLG